MGKTLTMAATMSDAKALLGDRRKIKKHRESAKKAAAAVKTPKAQKRRRPAKKPAARKPTKTAAKKK